MNYIAYYRVSTTKQGESGLGLDAQRAAVRKYVGAGSVVEHYTEVESGKNNHRPQLAAALQQARKTGARLVIAKLDRLSRNAAFVMELKASGVDFVAVDMPDANTLTIGIMAVMAQHEREVIASRTAAAAAARKARQLQTIATQLGTTVDAPAVAEAYRRQCQADAIAKGLTTDVLPKARRRSIAAKQQAAAECQEWNRAASCARALNDGTRSLRNIAAELNKNGFVTRTGQQFQAMTVRRLLAR